MRSRLMPELGRGRARTPDLAGNQVSWRLLEQLLEDRPEHVVRPLLARLERGRCRVRCFFWRVEGGSDLFVEGGGWRVEGGGSEFSFGGRRVKLEEGGATLSALQKEHPLQAPLSALPKEILTLHPRHSKNKSDRRARDAVFLERRDNLVIKKVAWPPRLALCRLARLPCLVDAE